jgi:hypothetical protein
MRAARADAECAICQKPFRRINTMQAVCGIRCAAKVAPRARKEAAAAIKSRREAIKPRSRWLQEAQTAFNAYIRKQDEFRGCISCGTNNGKMNAGHYLSVGARPELRFEEDNVHKQCERCNTYLHGNLLRYRAGLIGRIGVERVEWLEGPHPAKKYTVDDLRAIRDDYRAKLKELACE